MKIKFLGQAADNVTGSMIMVNAGDKNILLDCGMVQTNNLFKDYKMNSSDFPFKVKDIDMVIVSHLHCDHLGLLPKLYNRGFSGKCLVSQGSKRIARHMLNDSRYILTKAQKYIQKKQKTKICYDQKDVDRCISKMIEHPMNERFYLDDDTYIMFVPSGHIACSAQVIVWYKGKRIGYTGDLGNLTNLSFYTNEFEPLRYVDVLIGESTYGERKRNTSQRSADLKLLEKVIYETKGTTLLGCFSLGRSQEAMTHLYDLNIKKTIFADSPLTKKITNEYSKLFNMEEVLEWQNLRMVEDWKESQAIMLDRSSKIVIASQGMLQAGRSLEYTKHLISDPSNTIVLMGYCAEGTLGRQLQNGVKQVDIMGVSYDVNCRVETLHSFSSHMQRADLLDYYSNVNCNKLILTHGSQKAKLELKDDLEKEFYKKCKNTKVLISEKGLEIDV